MSTYLKIPTDIDDEAFREFYFGLTGEKIQKNVPTNEEETCYLIGSSRLDVSHLGELERTYPKVIVCYSYPTDFVIKLNEEDLV